MINLLRYFTFITIGFALNIACQKQNITPERSTKQFIQTNGGGFSRKANNSTQTGKTPTKPQEKPNAGATTKADDKIHNSPLAKSNYPKNKAELRARREELKTTLHQILNYQNRQKDKLNTLTIKHSKLQSKIIELKRKYDYEIRANNYEQARTAYYNAMRPLEFRKTKMPTNDYNSLKKWHYTQLQVAETEYNAWKTQHKLLYDLIEELEVLQIDKEIISMEITNFEQERMYLIRTDRTLEEIEPLIPEENLLVNEYQIFQIETGAN